MSGPVQFSFGNALDAAPGAQKVEWGGLTEEEDEAEEAPIRRPLKKTTAPRARQGPINVLKLAKARLKEVKAQLKEMRALEVERTELERLIAAAEVKPAAKPPASPETE